MVFVTKGKFITFQPANSSAEIKSSTQARLVWWHRILSLYVGVKLSIHHVHKAQWCVYLLVFVFFMWIIDMMSVQVFLKMEKYWILLETNRNISLVYIGKSLLSYSTTLPIIEWEGLFSLVCKKGIGLVISEFIRIQFHEKKGEGTIKDCKSPYCI